jgi:type I restriction enzyme M protein
LHGDAFQRSGARAKTSVLFLEKRDAAHQATQPSAFVYESRYIGLDDVVSRTRASIAELARTSALAEIEEIVQAFASYLRGETGPWLVIPSNLTGRLDAKYLKPWSVDHLQAHWHAEGVSSEVLHNLVDPVEQTIHIDPNQRYSFLRISYEGHAETGDSALGREISYAHVGQTQVGDIVVSNISAVYKAICVIPPGKDDLLVSSEFTVLRPKPGLRVDPEYLWSVLRSSAVIAQWISRSSGVGRHRVDWSILQDQRIPLIPFDRQVAIGDMYRQADAHHEAIASLKASAAKELERLDLENRTARDRLAAAKPPR